LTSVEVDLKNGIWMKKINLAGREAPLLRRSNELDMDSRNGKV
jgi:hypothetical protein